MYWILKTEPNTYSFSDLEKDKTTLWDGVRNYQARNNLKNMKVGDLALIYHSQDPREIVGVAKITKEAYADPKAKGQKGDWVCVEVGFVRWLKKSISLKQIKENSKLSQLSLVKQSRLSVCPVTDEEWNVLLSLID